MAFNFNWSPLTADADFYTRAKELLTAALNKSPKPPIIVDDILVNELNLGSVPPDLEILEIGDLAEDRFRGIFKMCYSGDAFLTLKTRVQANPLNTYLSTRPAFASPEPLAAASGLTIPLKITLSEIKLSAFIILVFSKQKGLTLVFRNDPLESLKVSSTFDSIPFVREYLQKEIEGQLRTLLMDEVPVIIHRLSLRLWVPEYRAKDDREVLQDSVETAEAEQIIDPLASPPQDPVDISGHVLDSAQIASLSLDSTTGPHSLFSQTNLLQLAALTDSHRTLSLFTPNMTDVVFRAWTGPMERGESFGPSTPHLFSNGLMSRKQSYVSTGTAVSSTDHSNQTNRPLLTSFGSSYLLSGLPSAKAGKTARKRKHRVVDLRPKKSDSEDVESISGESLSATQSSEASAPSEVDLTPLETRNEPITPPLSPRAHLHSHNSPGRADLGDSLQTDQEATPRPIRREQNPIDHLVQKQDQEHPQVPNPTQQKPRRPGLSRYLASYQYPQGRVQAGPSQSTTLHSPLLAAPFPYVESSPGGILEQAWMMKMAGEIARRVQDQKATGAGAGTWDSRHSEREETPPPAYTS